MIPSKALQLIRVISISLCLSAALPVFTAIPAQAEKPNVMIIFADDVGTGDVPGYWDNNRLVHMPNLQQLVADGTTFTDAHSTPLCAPSRYVLLSGNYQHRGEMNIGTWATNYDHGNQFRHKQVSLPKVFRDHGYSTAMFGKWHLGARVPLKDGNSTTNQKPDKKTLLTDENHDWTKPIEEGPWDIGFEKSYITLGGIQSPPYKFLRNGTLEGMNEEEGELDLKYWYNGEHEMPHGTSVISKAGHGSSDWDSTAYNMILVNETQKFIDDHMNNDDDKPFFTYVSLGSVHGPHSPPDEYIDGTPIAGQHGTSHLDMLSEMDKVVGSLVSILEQRQLTDNTIVLFTSDNGGINNPARSSEAVGHISNGILRDGKGTIYEGGSRVPMTFRWDNMIPKGEKRSSHFVGLNDIYATLCDLAGIEKLNEFQAVDSISFADYIFNNTATSDLRTTLGTWDYEEKSSFLTAESIRIGDLKLIHYNKNNIFELYDLSKDISESNNIISELSSIKLERMYTKLKRMGPCHNAKDKFHIRKLQSSRNCNYFKRKRSRCNRYPEGWLNCAKICSKSKTCQGHNYI